MFSMKNHGYLAAHQLRNRAIRTDVAANLKQQLYQANLRGSSQSPVVAHSKIRALTLSGCLAAKFIAHGPPPERA